MWLMMPRLRRLLIGCDLSGFRSGIALVSAAIDNSMTIKGMIIAS